MTIPSNPQSSIAKKTEQVIQSVREIKLISNQIIESIDGVNGKQLLGVFIVDKLNALVQLKAILASVFGADTKARILTEYPDNFTDAADVTAQVSATNANVVGLIDELHDLAQVVVASGQIINSSATTGTVHSVITSPASDALRAFCVSVVAAID